MRVIIAGSRKFENYRLLEHKCDNILKNVKDVEIVSGGAYGADRYGEMYSVERGHKLKRFLADWDQHGKKAGMLRNIEMAEYADALIAFWDGKSAGTKHMIEEAKARGLKVRVIKF